VVEEGRQQQCSGKNGYDDVDLESNIKQKATAERDV
jgi:hypothetical protein